MPQGFRSKVWSRIAHGGATAARGRWTVGLERFFAFLVRPLPASASITASILLGLWLASASVAPPEDEKLGYAETISPFMHLGKP
jgi:hypothetical protein